MSEVVTSLLAYQFQVYVMRLATEVNWTDEEECFRTFCEETAKFYAVQPNIPNARSVTLSEIQLLYVILH